MTRIELEKIGNRYYVSVIGHANYDDNGKDIVCAGISSLAQAFVLYCEQIEDLDRCSIIEETVTEGYVRFIVEGEVKYIEPAFEMMRLGLTAIAESYSNFVYLGGEKS